MCTQKSKTRFQLEIVCSNLNEQVFDGFISKVLVSLFGASLIPVIISFKSLLIYGDRLLLGFLGKKTEYYCTISILKNALPYRNAAWFEMRWFF